MLQVAGSLLSRASRSQALTGLMATVSAADTYLLVGWMEFRHMERGASGMGVQQTEYICRSKGARL